MTAPVNKPHSGHLGKPLGTVCKLKCQLIDGSETRSKAWSGRTLVRVSEVDGQLLTSVVILPFQAHDSATLDGLDRGQTFVVAAYESGSFVGIPEEAFEYIPICGTTDYHFESHLMILKKLDC